MDLSGKKILLHDMCLRDGMHARRHQFTVEEMVTVATALDAAGVRMARQQVLEPDRERVELDLPVVVKPADSQGQRGVTLPRA